MLDKLCFQIVFRPRDNEKFANVFEKLGFRGSLGWRVGLTGEIKARFQILPALSGRAVRRAVNDLGTQETWPTVR